MTITDIENVATAAAQPSVPRRIRLKRPTWFGGAVGICGLIALWWILAAAGVAGGTIPTPWVVVSTMFDDGWSLYGPNFTVTASGALQGFLWGNLLAITLAVLVVLIPPIEGLATQLAILSYCTPLLALGPIILVVFGGRTPTIFLAAMYCFFTTMVGTLAGLRSADKTSLDLVAAYGGGRWQKFTKVQLVSALPSTFAALKIAAPSAVLGAILGEYLGGGQRDRRRTNGRSDVVQRPANVGNGYRRRLARRSGVRRRRSDRPARHPVDERSGSTEMTAVRGTLRFLAPIAIASALLLVIWVVFLNAFPQVGPRVGKTPADVWEYLFSGPKSADARSGIIDNLFITLRDAGVGFAVGMTAALVVASIFVVSRTVEQTFMPVAMLLRSVPLVAMTPIIVLIFGRGIVGVTVMVAIVVFFPALVMIMVGLRAAPAQAQDLIAAYGGSRWTALRMVSVPSALPAVFAAARVSVPGALIGALIGEWLGSGQGLGSSMIKAIPRYQYNELWASIVVITVVSIVLYALVGIFESIALSRFGPSAGKS